MIDFGLIALLGFLGSFGHCVGMCGPLAIAFSLSDTPIRETPSWRRSLLFHSLLNLGRLLSYVLVGLVLGGLGATVIQTGQFAGVDVWLRRGLTIVTGGWLMWMGLGQILAKGESKGAISHPLSGVHQWLSQIMMRISSSLTWWMPLGLGLCWGLIPCGFLYVAQIKAAESGSAQAGLLTMAAFGVGTIPAMIAVGVSSAMVSRDRRSQLFRLGGWLTLGIGVLTLMRTAEMVDYTGHGALLCLGLALIARPVSRLWSGLLTYRRSLGLGAFILAVAHTLHMLEHSLTWQVQSVMFMVPQHQIAIGVGGIALLMLFPLALTSSDRMMKQLGSRWRLLHLLSVPALILSVGHAIWMGSHYFGDLRGGNIGTTSVLGIAMVVILSMRVQWIWRVFGIERWYGNVPKSDRA